MNLKHFDQFSEIGHVRGGGGGGPVLEKRVNTGVFSSHTIPYKLRPSDRNTVCIPSQHPYPTTPVVIKKPEDRHRCFSMTLFPE